METVRISPRAKDCLEHFQDLHDALSASEDDDHLQLSIRESSERFAVWASNLGAYHEPSDHRSADYRLREAPSISNLIGQYLDELLEVLGNSADIAHGVRPDASLQEEAGALDHLEDSEGIPDTEDSELGELCAITSDIITSLLKVSILIRQSTDRDRYAKAAASGDPPFLRDIDIQRISERFPKIRDTRNSGSADETDEYEWLRERLGNANVQRRQYLRYTRDHYNRLANTATVPKAQTLLSAGNQPAATQAPRPPSQAASSRPTRAPTDSSTLNIFNLPHDVSEQVFGQEDDADEALSFVSFQHVANTEEVEVKRRVARLEELSNGRLHFECPYCRGIIQPGTRSKWKKHVFGDLRAYVCTFKDCRAGLFEDRRAWFQHELEVHRRRWTCQMCPNSFDNSSDFEKHLHRAHTSTIPLPEMISSVVAASSRQISTPPTECPLCHDWNTQLPSEAIKGHLDAHQAIPISLNDFRRHLLDHLEQIALFAIPPDLPDEDARSSSGSHEHSVRTGKNAVSVERWREEANDDNEGDETDQEKLTEEEAYFLTLKELGPEHPDTLICMIGLATVLVAQWRWREAQELLEKVVDARQRYLGTEHLDTLASMANLAETYGMQGRFKEAQELQGKVVDVRQRCLGTEHPDTLASMANLAKTCSMQGRLKEAQELQERVLEIRQRCLGTDHPDTLTSMADLAETYSNQGRWKEAQALQEEVVDLSLRVLGTEHPVMLMRMCDLATNYLSQGRLKEAEQLQSQAVERMFKRLGTEHPNTIDAAASLEIIREALAREDGPNAHNSAYEKAIPTTSQPTIADKKDGTSQPKKWWRNRRKM